MYGALPLRAVGHVPSAHGGEVCLTRWQHQRRAPAACTRAQCVPTLPAIRQGVLVEIDDAVDSFAEGVSRDRQAR